MRIPREFLEEARRRCTPQEECVALLFGRDNAVAKWRWVRNLAGSPVAFRIDPEEMYRAITEAEEEGLELLAIFHTHPGPPTPSSVDLKYMRLWPVVWIISNTFSWKTTAWRLEKTLREVQITLQ
ncbi:Mov34/MPN/PAD-1 family protein [Pyrobaculum sp.]|uniref:Mov34/MPN/PAD-1 family protein n=1 Tax=Pyrobaculum sp. TaxID=2004705 RepID=UPI00317712CA